MDQKKTVLPTIWAQPVAQCQQAGANCCLKYRGGAQQFPELRLSSPLFKLGTRIVCGLNGSVWSGTSKMTHHLRSLFEDGPHGANMQCTSIIMNLHTAALLEGHMPRVLHIGADNTPKETKNSTTMACLIWLLCALMNATLVEVQVHFLMAGHTRNEVAPLARISRLPEISKNIFRNEC
jgi:hypothetical protein